MQERSLSLVTVFLTQGAMLFENCRIKTNKPL